MSYASPLSEIKPKLLAGSPKSLRTGLTNAYTIQTNEKNSKGMPSFLRHSPVHNLQKKKSDQQKDYLRTTTHNTAIKTLQNKIGQIGSILASTKMSSPKASSPLNKKKVNSKEPIKKTSPQANKQKITASTGLNSPSKKQTYTKSAIDNSIKMQSPKKIWSPPGIYNPRITAQNNQRARLMKIKSQNNLNSSPTTQRINSKLASPERNKYERKNSPSFLSSTVKNPKLIQNQIHKIRQIISAKQQILKQNEKQKHANIPYKSALTHFTKSTKCPQLQSAKPYSSLQESLQISQKQAKELKQAQKVHKTSTSSTISAASAISMESKNNVLVLLQNTSRRQSCSSIGSSTSNSEKEAAIKIEEFTKIKPLGQGKYSQVFLAIHRETGFLVALKQISKALVKKYNMVKQFSDQIRLHACLNHPNIIKLYGILQDQLHVYLILQYIETGSLFDYIVPKHSLGLKQTVNFMTDIISAVKYLHQKSIAHRDIKPQNILLAMGGVAKLCDLGWAACIVTSRKTYCGTFDYVPPQILERKDYDLSVDIWCLGILTYELLIGKVPYSGDRQTSALNKINNTQIYYPPQSENFSLAAKSFIQWLLRHNPQERPKANQLLNHQLFKSPLK